MFESRPKWNSKAHNEGWNVAEVPAGPRIYKDCKILLQVLNIAICACNDWVQIWVKFRGPHQGVEARGLVEGESNWAIWSDVTGHLCGQQALY